MKKARSPIDKHIVPIGGALSKSINIAQSIMAYVVGLSQANGTVKVLVINTATGDRDSTSLFAHRMLSGLNCKVSELGFFERTPRPAQMRELVLSQDIIFVNGGNTKSMLAVWREYGLPDLLRQAYNKGIVLAGSSAGPICWFEQCLTDSYADEYTALDCLGFLKGSCCPHFDGEVGRKETYHRLVQSGELKPGIAIDERVAVHFVNGKIKRVISMAEDTGAYNVTVKNGAISQLNIPDSKFS